MKNTYEQRMNSGIMFRNNHKQAANHPDWRGDINVNGTVFQISAWIKPGKRGEFLSLAVSEKVDTGMSPNPPSTRPAAAMPVEITDDDIPF